MQTKLIGLLALMGAAPLGSATAGDLGIYGKIGSTGLVAGLAQPVAESWVARVQIGGGKLDEREKISGIDYETKVELRLLGAFLDWHPFPYRNVRFTVGGEYHLRDDFDYVARADADGSLRINGRSYLRGTVGRMSGTLDLPYSFSPYIGAGWQSGDGGRGFSFVADAGVLYLGKGEVTLSAEGARTNPLLRADVDAERRQLEDDALDARFLPVLQVGVMYRF